MSCEAMHGLREREMQRILNKLVVDDCCDDAGPGIETILVHAGQAPDPATGARAVPLYQTASYVFESADHAADLFALKREGNIYTRLGNPTSDVFEQRVAAMEGGSGALATSSGMAAIFLAVHTVARAGDHIVAAASLYGGTDTLFRHTFERLGIDVTFIDDPTPESVLGAMRPETRLVFIETISNPGGDVPDIAGIAAAAHSAGVPLFVDNTFAPVLCRPLRHGADVVIHSATKWICGHGTSIGGVIVDGGRFDWTCGRFPDFTTPDESYHGVVYARDFGNMAFIRKARLQGLRNIGMCASPFNSFMFLQGLETLHLRIREQCAGALKLARWLARRPEVLWVNYPGLPGHPSHENARRFLAGGFGSVLGFGIRGGATAGARFIDSVKLASHLANIGDAKTLVLHPASTTHQQMPPEGLAACGITPEFIRVSVGLENVADIIADFRQAFATACGTDGACGRDEAIDVRETDTAAPVSDLTKFADIPGGLTLESGVRLPELRLAYRTWGRLNQAGDNAVVLCHALTGSADADDWWKGLIGSGCAADPADDFIVCANLPGSCYGSTGPLARNPATGRPWGPDFPALTVRDMVAAQAALCRQLGVRSIRTVIGGSLGGMMALEFAAMYPEMVRSAVSIAACARHSAWCTGLSEAQRATIMADPDWCGGRYDRTCPPAAGLAAARMTAMCTYRSHESFQARFGRTIQDDGRFAVESYLHHQGDKLVGRFDANTYMILTRAMDTHDLGRGRGGLQAALAAIRIPVLVVSYDSDVLYPTADQAEIAAGIPGARLETLHSPHGHDAFLIDIAQLARLIANFRAEVKS